MSSREYWHHNRYFWDLLERIHAATPSTPGATVPTLRHWMTSHVTWSRGLHASIIDPSISIYSRHSHTPDDLLRYREQWAWAGNDPIKRVGTWEGGGGRFSLGTMLRPQFVVADVPPPLRFYRPSFHDTATGPDRASLGKSLPSILRARKSDRTIHTQIDFRRVRPADGPLDHTHTHTRTRPSVAYSLRRRPPATSIHGIVPPTLRNDIL